MTFQPPSAEDHPDEVPEAPRKAAEVPQEGAIPAQPSRAARKAVNEEQTPAKKVAPVKKTAPAKKAAPAKAAPPAKRAPRKVAPAKAADPAPTKATDPAKAADQTPAKATGSAKAADPAPAAQTPASGTTDTPEATTLNPEITTPVAPSRATELPPPAEKPAETSSEKPAGTSSEEPTEKPAAISPEKPAATSSSEKPAEKPAATSPGKPAKKLDRTAAEKAEKARTEAWAKLIADPGHAPELLALAAVQAIGPRARDWAARTRGAYPTAGNAALARLATKQFTRASGLGSVFGVIGGPLALVSTAAITHAELILHLAAAYGLDPTDPERAVDLLVFTRVHESRGAAEAALEAARRPVYEDGGVAGAAWRMGRVVAAQAGGWGVVRLVNRYLPGVSLLSACLAGHAAAQTTASRASRHYIQVTGLTPR